MKNIFIIPTNKPSNIWIDSDVNELIYGLLSIDNIHNCKNQNIYITNDEELKKPCWCWDILQKKIYWVHDTIPEYPTIGNYFKKIILTTDQDLIKNGVQAINDEFLEWFVKNSSCDEVEVKYESSRKHGMWKPEYYPQIYKIIIPKKELKQIYYNTVGRENGVFVIKGQFNTQKKALDLANELNRKFPNLYYDWKETLIKEELKQDYNGVHFTHCYQGEYEDSCKYGEDDCPAKPLKNFKLQCKNCNDNLTSCTCIEDTIDMKQETLEEALDNYTNNPFTRAGFINGVNWQKERSYSEEDMRNAFIAGGNSQIKEDDAYGSKYLNYMKKRFEQFKKK